MRTSHYYYPKPVNREKRRRGKTPLRNRHKNFPKTSDTEIAKVILELAREGLSPRMIRKRLGLTSVDWREVNRGASLYGVYKRGDLGRLIKAAEDAREKRISTIIQGLHERDEDTQGFCEARPAYQEIEVRPN